MGAFSIFRKIKLRIKKELHWTFSYLASGFLLGARLTGTTCLELNLTGGPRQE